MQRIAAPNEVELEVETIFGERAPLGRDWEFLQTAFESGSSEEAMESSEEAMEPNKEATQPNEEAMEPSGEAMEPSEEAEEVQGGGCEAAEVQGGLEHLRLQ